MRAIVVERPNDVALRELAPPEPGPGDVRVRSVRAGVCRTDLDIVAGALDPRWVRFPIVPGHEWSGVVDEVGAGVAGFEGGERVVCEGNIPCLACPRCHAGETHLCANYDAVGFTRGGGFGELVVVPARVVHRLPAHVSFDAAVLVEPGSVVLKALERLRIQPAETVGVVGVGALGAIALTLARLHAPARLVAYGVREEELELARRLGADDVVDVRSTDAEAETTRLLGDGLDVVVETAGAVDALEVSTRIAREGGRIATLGIGYADGYRRALGNRASVLFHGRRARVVGVVTMDMTMIDVTDVQCEIGDIATLIGSDGADRIDVAELAEMGGLSPYEILTGLRGRLPRRYIGGEE